MKVIDKAIELFKKPHLEIEDNGDTIYFKNLNDNFSGWNVSKRVISFQYKAYKLGIKNWESVVDKWSYEWELKKIGIRE